ncbi:MAG: hypothetical protein GF383_07415 [Candidatus Lokiarchaeota archaeon]|nr:hypothetical protein [Candidatus Lokiarchaeota archaeon]MBD3340018.1 hypothetical protein [Candidatus Lokiarchaeota archaeon]
MSRIYPNFFITSQAEKGLSVDWSKYATPSFTLSHLPDPSLSINGIIELNVGKVKKFITRAALSIAIEHDPIREVTDKQLLNRAHTLINGIDKTNKAKVKRFLSKIANWAKDMNPIPT